MSTHKAAVIHARDKPLVVENVPRPVVLTGDAIVFWLLILSPI